MGAHSKFDFDPETFLKTEYVLPPLPAVVGRIKEIIEQDCADMAEISSLVSADPSLVVQVLKVVNSAYYSMPNPVTDIKYATAFLGLAELYRIVLTLAVVSTLEIKEEATLEEFWRDSFFTALTGKMLVEKFEPSMEADDLWAATLLHDVGRLLYAKFFPEELNQVNNYCREHGCLVEEAENFFEFPSRALFGSLLAQHWELPELITLACSNHDEKTLQNLNPTAPEDVFQRMICLAYLVSRLSEERLDEDHQLALSDKIANYLNLNKDQYSELFASINDLKPEVSAFVSRLA
ncbi:MAG: HDOD domain-containing protein [Gammaproteobacteria bacterium]|nr:HDOD domain-containing protein [Gammaproteobacteria bacterium]